ncbi:MULTISPECIES: Abi family protein [Lactobacillaceae]|uniref:Abi family protein n=1 Tax=Lactobacillaceae TaxID=33958 RepID=UPI0021C2E775|nr:Abi family protein [Lentilactobacillus hilgardii]
MKSEFHAYIQNEIEPFEDVDIDLSNGINKIHARVTGKSNSLPLRSEGIGKPKPVASFDEMISSLEKRIKIREKDKCRLQILIRENSYYRISYFAKLLFTEKPSIRPSFDNFYALIKLDSYIRTSVSRLTPTIEMFAKSTLAHVLLTIKKDSDVYLDKTIYKYNSTSDKKKLNRSLSVCNVNST